MEIVLRSAIVFFVLFLLVRIIGKRELAEMSGFEMILLIVLGDVIQQGVTQEDMSITGAILAVGTMVLLVALLAWLDYHWPMARRVIAGQPTVVMREGEILDEAARCERLTLEDLRDAARQRGIEDLSEVRIGVLEADGRFTFLT